MPRHADPDARRGAIADAVLDVALASGLDRVSIPRTAAAAGVSVGLVQHYFPTKAELLTVAYARLTERVDDRIARLVDAGEARGSTIRAMATHSLQQLLPLDGARRAEAVVRAEFATRALRDPELAWVAARAGERMLHRLGAVVVNGRACGESDPTRDPGQVAADLLVGVEGTAALLLAGVEVGAGPLDEAVARAFPGTCHRRRRDEPGDVAAE